MEFSALFESAEEGGYIISFPDLDWGVTQGENEADAREMALEALVTMIQELIRAGEPIPSATRPRGRKYRLIRLPALQTAKAELHQHFCASGMRKAELARRLGISKSNVDRLFNLNHHSRLEQIEAAFRVLGKDIQIEVRDAA